MAKKATRRAARRRTVGSKASRTRSRSSKGARQNNRTAAKVAERAKPGWSVVDAPATAADAASDAVHPDASVPELTRLKQKYFGADRQANGVNTPTNDAEIVTMEPKAPAADYRAGRKAVVVQRNRVIGMQG